MPSRKKAYVLLRGNIGGRLIVGTRKWYEIENIARGKLWKLVCQSDDRTALWQMATLGNNEKSNANEKLWPEGS